MYIIYFRLLLLVWIVKGDIISWMQLQINWDIQIFILGTSWKSYCIYLLNQAKLLKVYTPRNKSLGTYKFTRMHWNIKWLFRVILERVFSRGPHPWGLKVTVVQLFKRDDFWNSDFVNCDEKVRKESCYYFAFWRFVKWDASFRWSLGSNFEYRLWPTGRHTLLYHKV